MEQNGTKWNPKMKQNGIQNETKWNPKMKITKRKIYEVPFH